MITLLIAILSITSMNMLKNNNPMKASITILVMSSILFLIMSSFKGSTWLPLILFLLYMGGILMMFMILSAISPNEYSKKMKMSFILITTTMIMSSSKLESLESQQTMIKQILSSNILIMSVTMLMCMYFFSFLSMLTEQKTSMRSLI